ncbi:uroporphyrinogen-III C-methyltransferase [Syntrophotalea acetylenivorans]|uniref:uroporphyrinogen-III C-methyltransferase n=1 Tax=Syntrophotalea acetylenivorans TaxID=1842532 RepID=A0A1L3GRF4_9BACT|nr:uroporphyrinogen-III C-methyltransferase [Syntrophotalea acetylenivorans]APG28507.1 uroporphyrinogen-III C-methyltransferase [Syntrophotalea acetylenivorans]
MKQGIVYLIGAGPGDPGLITVKGRDCLRRAEVVVYDYLANPALLAEAPPEAERIFVGKTRGQHHTPQPQINALLVERAQRGQVVARLKGGDPYVFGRGGEEAEELVAAGVPFEVVPGISAGFAAAAYAGIPLTHREFTTSLGLVTGHENPEKKVSNLDWQKLATGVGTLVFYMGMTNLALIAEQLMANGRDPQTPVAVIRWGTTPQQQTVTATLGDVVEKVAAAGLKPPAVIVIGEVVRLRDKLRWFDQRPLFGRKVLVTRSPQQAYSLAGLLQTAGAEAICLPTVEIAPPSSWKELDAAISELAATDYLVLTSANGVSAFFERLSAAGLDGRSLQGVTIVAVGPKTASAIAEHGLRADLIPQRYQAEGIVELLQQRSLKGKRILYPRSASARDLLCTELRKSGAEVRAPVAYRTKPAADGAARLQELLSGEKLDAVTFTSASTVEHCLALLAPHEVDCLDKAVIAAIGPLTAAAARKHGLTVDIEPNEATCEALVEALGNYFQKN